MQRKNLFAVHCLDWHCHWDWKKMPNHAVQKKKTHIFLRSNNCTNFIYFYFTATVYRMVIGRYCICTLLYVCTHYCSHVLQGMQVRHGRGHKKDNSWDRTLLIYNEVFIYAPPKWNRLEMQPMLYNTFTVQGHEIGILSFLKIFEGLDDQSLFVFSYQERVVVLPLWRVFFEVKGLRFLYIK